MSNPLEKFVISVVPSDKAPIRAARWEIDLSGGKAVTSPLKTLMSQWIGVDKKKATPVKELPCITFQIIMIMNCVLR